MRYNTSKLPDDRFNIPREHPLAVLGKLMASLAIIGGILYLVIGASIDVAITHIKPEHERKLLKLIAVDQKKIKQKQSAELEKILGKFSQCTDLPYEPKIAIMYDKRPNAFALPGGQIYVTSGLIKKAQSENELAFIVGHELGHFANKDHLRMLGYRVVFAVLGYFLGGDYGAAASTALDIGNAKYSQEAEYKADAYGLKVMQCAYGNVADATKMFERMNGGEEWKYFLSTHPAFNERIVKMKEQIKRDGMIAVAPTLPFNISVRGKLGGYKPPKKQKPKPVVMGNEGRLGQTHSDDSDSAGGSQ